MELKEYLSILWRWKWLIVLAVLVSTAASYWATEREPRVFATSTTLMVGHLVNSPDPTTQELATTQQLASSYAQLVRREPILQGVIDTLELDASWTSLRNLVYAEVIAGTQLLQITVADTDPQRAKIIADEIAHQLILQSPTTPQQEQAENRRFVGDQLQDLRSKIETTEQTLVELQSQLASETSAQAIDQLQSQINGNEQKILTWQNNYASLIEFYEGSQINSLTVVEPATVPTRPISPNPQQNLLLAAALGFALAVAGIFVVEYLDDTVRSVRDIEDALGLPVPGAISRLPKVKRPTDALVAWQQPRSLVTEDYRTLRTNLRYRGLTQGTPVLLVTSALPRDGKTTLAANLGVILAAGGQRVILVDADLHHSMAHELFDVPAEPGLASLLSGESDVSLEEALVDTAVPRLRLLPSGATTTMPTEWLGSWRMEKLIAELRTHSDIVLIDSPPLLAVSDAAILGTLSTALLFIVRQGHTRKTAAQQGKAALEQLGLNVAGVIVNQTKSQAAAQYYRSYARPRKPAVSLIKGRLNGSASHAAAGLPLHDTALQPADTVPAPDTSLHFENGSSKEQP